MSRTTLMQHFHLVTLFDLTLTFTQYKVHTYMLPFSPLEKPVLATLRLVAVISSVLAADRAKSGDFDICPCLDPTCDLLEFF